MMPSIFDINYVKLYTEIAIKYLKKREKIEFKKICMNFRLKEGIGVKFVAC